MKNVTFEKQSIFSSVALVVDLIPFLACSLVLLQLSILFPFLHVPQCCCLFFLNVKLKTEGKCTQLEIQLKANSIQDSKNYPTCFASYRFKLIHLLRCKDDTVQIVTTKLRDTSCVCNILLAVVRLEFSKWLYQEQCIKGNTCIHLLQIIFSQKNKMGVVQVVWKLQFDL